MYIKPQKPLRIFKLKHPLSSSGHRTCDTEWACFLGPCSCHTDQLPALYPGVTEHLHECRQREALSPASPPLGRLCPFPHTALPMCAHQYTFSGFLWPCRRSWLSSMSLFMFSSPFSLHVIFTYLLHFCLPFPLSVTHFCAMARGFIAGRTVLLGDPCDSTKPSYLNLVHISHAKRRLPVFLKMWERGKLVGDVGGRNNAKLREAMRLT